VKALGGKPKITCIVDNTVQSGSRLWGEHGLAFLVEIGDRRVLFDTGQSGVVLRTTWPCWGLIRRPPPSTGRGELDPRLIPGRRGAGHGGNRRAALAVRLLSRRAA
jgi:hypothetical protein